MWSPVVRLLVTGEGIRLHSEEHRECQKDLQKRFCLLMEEYILDESNI